MLSNDLVSLSDSSIAIPLLRAIIDKTALKVISSTIDVAKNIF
ncbi:MAG TPA: hypothetical protein VIP70_13890 [Nitrososphaeraceae archaeon]